MEESYYHETANIQMQKLADMAEALEESHGLDVEFEAGVLTLTLPNKRQYVINKHTPSRQIWVSSPVSGAGYYEYIEGEWLPKRQQTLPLYNFIEQELKKLLAND